MKNKEDFINYKLQKAAQSIKESKLLVENKIFDTALSRLYYGAFYAVNALLFSHGFNPKTHTGTKSIFNKEFILTKKVEGHYADYYSFVMAKRFEADYDDFVFIDENKVESLIIETEDFIKMISALIKI